MHSNETRQNILSGVAMKLMKRFRLILLMTWWFVLPEGGNSLTTCPVFQSVGDTSSTSSSRTSTTSTTKSIDCNEKFYSQLNTLQITCEGSQMDIHASIQSAKCVLYSDGSTTPCLASCSLPICNSTGWSYSENVSILSKTISTTFRNLDMIKFMNDILKTYSPSQSQDDDSHENQASQDEIQETSSLFPRLVFPLNFQHPLQSSKSCPQLWIDSSNQLKTSNGLVESAVGKVVGPIISTVVGGAVAGSIVLALRISSNLAGIASGSLSILNGAILMFEQSQFICMLGQLKLSGASDTFKTFTLGFSWTNFNFKNDAAFIHFKHSDPVSSLSMIASTTGMGDYARRLGMGYEKLFLTTLLILAILYVVAVVLFGIALTIACLLKWDFKHYLSRWWDRLLGAWMLLTILGQYAFIVTGVFEIYLAFYTSKITFESVLAVFVLLFASLGMITLGCWIIKKNQLELVDVGTTTHENKQLAKRFGLLYQEFKYENRYFFVIKMVLALLAGGIIGCVALRTVLQMVLLILLYVFYTLYLLREQPYQTKSMQKTAVFLCFTKIISFFLAFFLVQEISSFSNELRKAISCVIVMFQLLLLLGLLARQLYIMWKKFSIKNQQKNELGDDELDGVFYTNNSPFPHPVCHKTNEHNFSVA